MSRRAEDLSGRVELLRVIRRVRRRWRFKLALKGAALALAAGVAALLVSASALERLGFTPSAALALRIALAAAVLGAVVWFLVLPLLRRVSDERVALYLEEHEPSLDAAVLSAIGAPADAPDAGGEPAISPALVRRTIETAIEKCRAIDDGRWIERGGLARHAALLTGVLMVAAIAGLLAPPNVRHAASLLLFPSRGAAAPAPVRIDVAPGDTTVARGADQVITARLYGIDEDVTAELVLRSAADSTLERVPMAAAEEPGTYGFLLFDLDAETEYFVEADGVRSAIFRIAVAELPYVERLELEYRFPAYTGLSPQTVDDGGDIAALEGTVVHLRVTPTIPVPGGRIVLDDGQPVALTAGADGVLTGTLRVQRKGLYHIEFELADGRPVNGSPQYIIDVLSDMPPTVSFSRPGRDTRATPIEEVFIEAEAEDDYGIGELEVIYSVNGGPEQTLSLYRAERPLAEVTAGHTFYLEEFGLEPGDFISYYARATDNNAVGGQKSATSDIYFLQIFPFSREFRQADQGGMPGGGGAGGGPDGQLSERQRQIIAATFNLVRDRERYTPDAFDENLTTIRLAQERLAEETRTLGRRMIMRGVTADTAFERIAGLLPRAADEMDAAIDRLRASEPDDALPPEQRALQHLQRAEAVFREVQVAMGGGGGGGGSPSAEDLADLFELELDKLRNQYETLQRGAPDAAQEQIDETLERLRELARRQEQENERLRRRAMAAASGAAGGQGGATGESQRELAEQAEQAARQLERLSRELSRPELMESARRLQQAADAMRRSAANGTRGVADANSALDRLEQARRLLERTRGEGLERDAQDALRRAQALAAEQRELAREMEDLVDTPPGSARNERARRLRERKHEQAAEVSDLEREVQRLAAAAGRDQANAARELREAAGSIGENQLKEKIDYSRRLTEMRNVPPEYVRALEAEIGQNLDELRDRLAQASNAFEAPAGDPTAEALEQARDLARGVESLNERLRQASEAAERQARAGGQQQGQQPGQNAEGAQGAQGGQGGEQGADGGANGGQQGGGAPGGRVAGGGGPDGGWWGGRYPDGAVRQFRRELRERIADAEALRDRLRREGRDVGDLEQVIRGMRALDDETIYGDPGEVDRLRASIADRMKRFEYGLRQELGAEERAGLFLSGSGEVPAGFQTLVEEYYRTLSETRQR